MGTLVNDLTQGRTLIETHISWVLLEENYVYKVKKPVDFGFLDFTTLERRHAACLTEVRLNSRLSHDVYLGVAPITRDQSGQHHIAGAGEVVDYCVHMRRLNESDRLDVRLKNESVSAELVERLGEHLVRFHAHSATNADIARFGDVSVIRRNVEENFEQTRAHLTEFMSAAAARELERLQLAFLADNTEHFAARLQEERIRDGHGDLRLEHIYSSRGTFEILDCIEFNDRFRYADVACDIAFATMELRHYGRPDLAELLLSAYATETTDFSLYRLIDFYESYRATVRAKVNAFVAVDGEAQSDARRLAHERATRLFAQALSAVTPRPRGQVIAIGGLIAAGKSHTSARLSNLLTCPVVATDRVRKYLLSVDRYTNLATGSFAGAYSEATTQRTYQAVREYAAEVTSSGRPVIVDASFRSRHEREALRDWCSQVGCTFSFVECVAADNVLRERLQRREQTPSVSDGREDLLDAFMERYEPPEELPNEERCTLDTTQSDAKQSRVLLAFLESRGGSR